MKKKETSKSRDEVYVKSRPSSLSLQCSKLFEGVFFVSVDDNDDDDEEEKFYIRTVNSGDTLQAILGGKKKIKKKGEYYFTFT